jgi:hypothetical protein
VEGEASARLRTVKGRREPGTGLGFGGFKQEGEAKDHGTRKRGKAKGFVLFVSLRLWVPLRKRLARAKGQTGNQVPKGDRVKREERNKNGKAETSASWTWQFSEI